MRYWKCQCGEYEQFGSDGPRLCQVCKKCGTTLLKSEEGYMASEPHDPVISIEITIYRGEVRTKSRKYCAHCMEEMEI